MATKIINSFNDQLMEQLIHTGTNVNKILKSSLVDISCSCDRNSNATISKKGDIVDWTFKLSSSSKSLKNILLLSENGDNNFHLGKIEKVLSGPTGDTSKSFQPEPNTSEWQNLETNIESEHQEEYKVTISFKAEIFGIFRQTVVFSFGSAPYLRKDVSVEVKPASDSLEELQLKELQDILVKHTERWNQANCVIKDFQPSIQTPNQEDQFLYRNYPMPQPTTFRPSKNVVEPNLTKFNYKDRMHDLLYIEEMAQFEQISQFNVKTDLTLIDKYMLTTSSSGASNAKYARLGELFGKMTLKGSLSKDTTAGRLILTNCTSLMLKSENKNDTAYLSVIEDSGKSTLYLRLSSSFVQDFKLNDGDEFSVEVQFQLNR